MRHPFTVGSTYANNHGAYTVLEIVPPVMQVRYVSGREQALDIELQTRIWARLQRESEEEEQREARRTRRPRQSRRSTRALAFSGLTETDFKDNVTGTTWRSKTGLGGLVARHLSTLTGRDYSSWAIPRQPRCFIHASHLPMRNKTEGVKAPKFVIRLNAHEMRYGFYIEKSDEPMDDTWYWPRFLGLLAESEWQQGWERAMSQRELHWLLYQETQQGPTGTWASAGQTTASSFAPGSPFPSFASFVDYLHGLPSDHWCNLYLIATLAKQEAMEKGAGVAEHVARTLAALAPMCTELLNHR